MSKASLRVLNQVGVGVVERVAREVADIELIEVPESGEIAADVEGEVLLTLPWENPNLAEVIEHGVRWIHAFGTGVNKFPFELLGDRVLTCSRGASAIPISEWVLAVMLAAEKKLPEAWVTEAPELWSITKLGKLHGRTLGLIGIGGIGQAVAERALPFGMKVRAYRRSDTPSPHAGVEVVEDLNELLAESDHLVVTAPATPATRHLLDAAAFACVKRGVHLVNVSRGEIIDQDALREALDDGRVGLASLDVAEPEPLPAGHWLYTHPRVRFSPHTSWSMPGALDLLIDPFIENIERYRAGKPLIGRVDPDEGY